MNKRRDTDYDYEWHSPIKRRAIKTILFLFLLLLTIGGFIWLRVNFLKTNPNNN